MPIYEFHCEHCDKTFEFLTFRRDEIPRCPTCHGERVAKKMSACCFTGKNAAGETVSRAAGTSSCSSCSASSCAGCGGA